MALFELLETNAPPYAMATYTGLASQVKPQYLARVVNGVLRNVTRSQESGTLRDPLVCI